MNKEFDTMVPMERILKLPSSLYESLEQVEILVSNVYETNKLSPQAYGNMLVTLSEAVTNAILHGNHSDEQKNVEISYSLDELHERIEFRVKDEGNGFDFSNLPDPTTTDNLYRVNGRGVMIMNSLADDISFEENGTVVVLKFKLNN